VRKVDSFTLAGRNLLRRINYVIKIGLFLIQKREIMSWRFK
jgi:hypothetical protein